MEFFEALYGRRATRAFSPQLVSRPVIERLIDAAIQASSAVSEQPWDFAIIQNGELLDRIAIYVTIRPSHAPLRRRLAWLTVGATKRGVLSNRSAN